MEQARKTKTDGCFDTTWASNCLDSSNEGVCDDDTGVRISQHLWETVSVSGSNGQLHQLLGQDGVVGELEICDWFHPHFSMEHPSRWT